MKNIKASDLKWIGYKNNKLTVIKPVYSQNRWLWLCKCECGNETIVYPYLMRTGKQKSCHCGKSVTFREMNTTHGESSTRLYEIWCGIKKRCNNKNNKNYHQYGGKGISVCEKWNNDYISFKDWALSHGYSDGLTIDRIDNNGNYEPDNCRWITIQEQSLNRSSNLLIEIDGETKPLSEWCKQYNLNYSTIYSRYHRGMDLRESILKDIK